MDRTCFYFKKIGHDGIIYENKHEGIGVSYIVFNPNQIKSATDNVGTFSNNSNDLRFSISDNGGQNLSEAERQEIKDDFKIGLKLGSTVDEIREMYVDADEIGVSYIVFNPNQIKSATDNVGTCSFYCVYFRTIFVHSFKFLFNNTKTWKMFCINFFCCSYI